tara:strand:+ start:125 stop:520 length:396 start_codon:yes stop_codon:yes gene_type:complete
MSVTLNATLTLSSTDISSDTLNLTVTDSLSLGANDARINRRISPNDVNPGGTQIFDTNLGKSYIYAKNTHASKTIWLAPAADTATGSCWMSLAPGEFAFFAWAGAVDLFAHSGADGQGVATDGLEYMIFEA